MNVTKIDGRLAALQAVMINMPQVELETKHYFANGMYAREVFRPAGTTIVGKIHKHEHLFIVTKGCILVWTDGDETRMEAPCVLVSKPGTKRATYAETDAVAMTVHRTDKTNLDEIEAEIIEAEDLALFDSSNKVKALP